MGKVWVFGTPWDCGGVDDFEHFGKRGKNCLGIGIVCYQTLKKTPKKCVCACDLCVCPVAKKF